jgi:hypothetical protein
MDGGQMKRLRALVISTAELLLIALFGCAFISILGLILAADLEIIKMVFGI